MPTPPDYGRADLIIAISRSVVRGRCYRKLSEYSGAIMCVPAGSIQRSIVRAATRRINLAFDESLTRSLIAINVIDPPALTSAISYVLDEPCLAIRKRSSKLET